MSVKGLLAGIITALLITAGASQAANAEPLRIFYFNWAGYGPLFLAQDKGFFAEEGIAVELINVEETHAAIAGLFAGQVDAVTSAPQDTVFFYEPDQVLICVLATEESRGGDGVVANKEIRKIADLKGKTVVFERGSISHFYLNVLLQEAGLSEADIEPLDLPDADGATAFLLQEADATVTWGTMLIQAKQAPHGHLLTDSTQKPGLITGCLATTPELLADRRADFQALGRAWDAAVDYANAHPDEATAIMAARMGDSLADPAIFAESLAGVRLYDGERNREYFGTPDRPGQIYQTVQYAIDIWSRLGVLKFELSPADVIRHDLWTE